MALATEGEIVAFEENLTINIDHGGFEFVFEDELSSGQKCPICLLAMRNPVQTTCGHRFCESCLVRSFSQNGVPVCPQDRQPIPKEEKLFRDVAWEREILCLRVKCKRTERGCDWIGQIRHYQEHSEVCDYEDVTCDDCDGQVQRCLLGIHTASECPKRIVQCGYCKDELEVWRTEIHEQDECPRFPFNCPQECGMKGLLREEVESHVRDYCMLTMVDCPYKSAGCTFYDKRHNLKAHVETSRDDHLENIYFKTTERLEQCETEMVSIKQRLDELEEAEEEIRDLQIKQVSMKELLDTKGEEISELRLSGKKLEKENKALKKDVAELQSQLDEVERTTAGDMQKVTRVVQMLCGKFQTMQHKQPPNPATAPTQPPLAVPMRPQTLVRALPSNPLKQLFSPTESAKKDKIPDTAKRTRTPVDPDYLAKKRKIEKNKTDSIATNAQPISTICGRTSLPIVTRSASNLPLDDEDFDEDSDEDSDEGSDED